MPSFKRVLIANRGAIATRIIRTLDRLGIESVAVYADSDRDSLHVQHASVSESLGAGGASDTYLNIDRLLTIAQRLKCDAIHPGYGFLSENAEFVARCESASIAFVGPTSKQLTMFGQKHIARELAFAADVPLPPGSGLLADLEEALLEASSIGYPIMLKSTAGGGGIGMQLCNDPQQLKETFGTVKRLGGSNFSNDGVFLEKAILRARHIEVQVFGDGLGGTVSLGERDCSAQRRNQKVVEECPAPNLSDDIRQRLYTTAESLLASVNYRNAGTVEFIYDVDDDEFYFLEVNTRLQVEHGVTELVYNIDLVEWMIKQAEGLLPPLDQLKSSLDPSGHAIQTRVYAEDPYQGFRPSPGPLSYVNFPSFDGVRIDHWIESGVNVSPDFDPMLAKVLVHSTSRDKALSLLSSTLNEVQLYGSETNLEYLQSLILDPVLAQGQLTTRYLDSFNYQPNRVDVVRGGTLTTLQDSGGRIGYWSVGIPPSGPFDSLSFDMANQLLGNPDNAAGLEITLEGPSLRFSQDCAVVVTGADVPVTLEGELAPMWTLLHLKAGQLLDIGRIKEHGARSYLCVQNGFNCPDYLGSKSTFTLGQFGGHNGSAIKAGDVLRRMNGDDSTEAALQLTSDVQEIPEHCRPDIGEHWTIRVVYGPHGAPDFFTADDIDMVFGTQWQVHYNSSRTGVRLIGPAPQWARTDGGEAGLHPSNIHDNAYAFGSIDFTGDMPVILGPDGPSLGGFVCPATVIHADLWKLGQLRAGNQVRFHCVTIDEAIAINRKQVESTQRSLLFEETTSTNTASIQKALPSIEYSHCSPIVEKTVLTTNTNDKAPTPILFEHLSQSIKVVYRAAGDSFLLIEYGEPKLDLVSRFRVHALMSWIDRTPFPGIVETTPGIRSLQIHYDFSIISVQALLDYLIAAEDELDATSSTVSVPSRIVHLPLSWNDEACQLAIDKYDQSVRKDAPWYPSNLEFIRRINGLESIDAVKDVVFSASYLVMGLGDVYLGAPVATPINPAHRLVTTKYNPARTWTAENSVGIGGSYLCVYGMEGPGGYQFVGRTLQMWNRYKQTQEFEKPWLLRFFDQIRFYEVSEVELKDIRRDFPHGRHPIKIEDVQFSLAEFQTLIEEQQNEIESFQHQREAAFSEELTRWRATGQFNISTHEPDVQEVEVDWPEHCVVVESPVSGNVWQHCVEAGEIVAAGTTLLILESMKMEINVSAPERLQVRQILFESGQRVTAGQPIIVLEAI